MKQLSGEDSPTDRIRKQGGGRKSIEYYQPGITEFLELEANPKTDKRVVVKWTSHSFAHIAEALVERGYEATKTTVGNMLHDLGYALKANKKDIEGGKDHPDRDAQFQHINMAGLTMQLQGFPIISIDAKKTEKIGNLKNQGKEWHPPGEETKVNVYDFPTSAVFKK